MQDAVEVDMNTHTNTVKVASKNWQETNDVAQLFCIGLLFLKLLPPLAVLELV